MTNRKRDIFVVAVISVLTGILALVVYFAQIPSPIVKPQLTTKQQATIDGISRSKFGSRGSYGYRAFGGYITKGKYALNPKNTYTSVFTRYLKEGIGGTPKKSVTTIVKLSNKTTNVVKKQITKNDLVISIELENLAVKQNFGKQKTAKLIGKIIKTVHSKNKDVHVLVLSAWGNNTKIAKYNAAVKKVVKKHNGYTQFINISKISKQDDVTGPADLYTHYGISDDVLPNNFGMRLIAYEMFNVLHQTKDL